MEWLSFPSRFAHHQNIRLKGMPQNMFQRVPLHTVLSSPYSILRRKSRGVPGISRVDRLATATAATWAVLLLCGTPWLEQTQLGKQDIELHLSDVDGYETLRPSVACFSHTFRSPHVMLDINQEEEQGTYCGQQIRHKTLFSLGILLIELALNTSFEELCKEAPDDHTDQTRISEDVYTVANEVIEAQTLEFEVGESYTFAVQRCLQCQFLGRSSTMNFSHAEFRRQFYAGVVAPVQATYDGEVHAASFREPRHE
jgi:hypothetical protein